MLRSGVICGGSGGDGSGNMLKTALGGSHVARQLRQYVADRHNMGGGSTCNKAQRSNIQLIPGLMLFWCLCCRRACCSPSCLMRSRRALSSTCCTPLRGAA